MQTAVDIMRTLSGRAAAVHSDEPSLRPHVLSPGSRCELRPDTDAVLVLSRPIHPLSYGEVRGTLLDYLPYVSARLALVDELNTGTVFAKCDLDLFEMNLATCRTLVAESNWFRDLFFQTTSRRLRSAPRMSDWLQTCIATYRLH